jgi:hypothetical protein
MGVLDVRAEARTYLRGNGNSNDNDNDNDNDKNNLNSVLVETVRSVSVGKGASGSFDSAALRSG